MASNARILYLHALTPVHAGTGQAVAVIDLPIARDKVTGWPLIPASSVKGVLRDHFAGGRDDKWIQDAFGQPEAAGALSFGDQHLLCLPIRSYHGTFSYVTCPLALTRFLRDLRALGLAAPFAPPKAPAGDLAAAVTTQSVVAREQRVLLEDLDLKAVPAADVDAAAAALAAHLFTDADERNAFTRRFAVVSDDVFNFLCETGTEASARVRLKDETKTVEGGALWYEEAVPAESIFWGPAVIPDPRRWDVERIFGGVQSGVVQVGGKSSVGRGLCRLVVAQ